MISSRTPDAPRPSENSFSAMISRDDGVRQRLADAAAMRQDQVALQRRVSSAAIMTDGEFAEAGVDAIDRLVPAAAWATSAAAASIAGRRGGVRAGGQAPALDALPAGRAARRRG